MQGFALEAAPGKVDPHQENSNTENNTNSHRSSRQEVAADVADDGSRRSELGSIRHDSKKLFEIYTGYKAEVVGPTCPI